MSENPGPITVYGATGYTGKLVAAELEAREAPFILAGRSREKLESLADSLGSNGRKPEVHPVPNTDAKGLRELFSRSGAVIACAGPFSLHGEPVLAAAVEAGVPYLDTTGEQDFIRRVFEVYGPRASKAGSPVIPAMGFDYVPGDMLVALTAAALPEGETLDKVRIAYHAPFQPSRGTMRSAIEMIKGGDVEWRDRALRPASQSVARPDFDFGGRLGIQKMMHYPAAEHITVPTHLAPRTVETGLTVSSFAPGAAGQTLLPPVNRLLGLTMRTPLRKAMSAAISAMPEGADQQSRSASNFTIACEVTSAASKMRGTLTGTDVYGLTAALIVEGAIRCAGGEVGTGALAPAGAFEPAGFLTGFERFGVKWEVGPSR
ncbi:MAG: saccharopine dehydrogenase NADP-binding domain-containing protein [Solirubrobacterales bacterium]|nr:saccharopine dehydrogenase NADP-binding domain-containing protein [Solirubrobacterales bacterium]